MVRLIDAAWMEQRLDTPEVLVLDPRSRMKYLQGHLKGAINLPATRFFDSEGRLLPSLELGEIFGSGGLTDTKIPVIYDSYDGQKGALVAWVLEHLGRSDVCLMDTFYEGWAAQGKELFYRPVMPTRQEFKTNEAPNVRAKLRDVQNLGKAKLLDVRSVEEFKGQSETDVRPGHIPGSSNIPWLQFLGVDHHYLDSLDGIKQRLSTAGILEGDSVITSCRVGMRAAVGYLALQQLGYNVRLYDGSYAEWEDSGLPVESCD